MDEYRLAEGFLMDNHIEVSSTTAKNNYSVTFVRLSLKKGFMFCEGEQYLSNMMMVWQWFSCIYIGVT